MTNPANHIETLLAYADGALSPVKAKEVEAHLAAHPEDAELVGHYRLVKQRHSSDDSVEPSASAMARALAIFNSAALPRRERASWLAAIDRIIARCVFDSRVEALAVRSTAAEQLVNVSYESSHADIDLQAERIETGSGSNDAHWQFLGQINSRGANVSGVRIALTESGAIVPLAECIADEFGSFQLHIAPGRYDLHVQLASGVVVLPNLDMT